jgi:hypothetical protein
MPVNPALAVTVPAGVSLYRITAVSFHTTNAAHHKKVVNGMGARGYNYGGVLTVYLADCVEACFAERMFYFQREVVRRLDALHPRPSTGDGEWTGIGSQLIRLPAPPFFPCSGRALLSCARSASAGIMGA